MIQIFQEEERAILLINDKRYSDLLRVNRINDSLVISGYYTHAIKKPETLFNYLFEKRLLELVYDLRTCNDPELDQIIANDSKFVTYLNKLIQILKIEQK